ncbi:hypothetical protein MKY15_20590 [Sporosarcina sp. FSL K6-1540]|uniref:hypothetical protein n=1 Tax=Sporosarcina sp. FSL K6-1540 TaxID=2921555 RepID=UPI00315AB9B1
MTNELTIDIQRTGFPVKIGTVELWFDSSLENLRSFFNIEEVAQEKLKEAQEKASHIHFPAEITIENLDDEMVDAAFDVKGEFLAAQYDVLFGDGTFKKIYKKHPDILALEQTLEIVGVAISKRIEEQESVRAKETESKKAEYLNKKAQKK